MLAALAIVVLAYLIGSVSFAVVVSRAFGLPDPHDYGSGNPGATNVLRTGNRAAALITLLGDGLKGFVAVLVAQQLAEALGAASWTVPAAALAVFLGHLYPLYHGFRGGKGVATALGVQFGLWWPIGLTVAAVWLFVAKVLRISSLSALVSMALAPLIVWFFWPEPILLGMQVLISLLLFWRHRSNIANLISGQEGKIGRTDEDLPGV